MKNKRTTLLRSAIALLLCVSMLVGTTFAWFTDSVSTGINTIAAGNLDVELYHSNAAVADERVDSATKLFMDLQGEPILWEPGVVSYENLRVANEGDLALAYQLALNTANENYIVDPSGAQYGLSQILKVGFVEGGITATDRAGVVASVADANWTTLADFLRNGSLPADTEQTWGVVIYWQPGENDNLWNLNNGKHLNQGDTLSIELGIKLIATQEVYESDSFGNDYDATAKQDVFPDFVGGSASMTVVPDAQNRTSSDASMSAGKIQAFVPAGVQLAAGATELKLNVSNMSATGSNVVLDDHEAMRSLDVHIEGVDPSNTAPITVTLEEIAPVGLNMGNYKLYHVENGSTVEMTLVGLADPFTAHNQFKYDPATGDITLYMATFSEVAMVAEPAKWEGNFDYSWYTNAVTPADGEAVTEYVIANADQLAAFGAIVGGMDGQTQDSFKDKTVKLISDINLGDKESENNPDVIFYPIGYYNSEGTYERTNTGITSGLRNFEGTFDGNGHTVFNFYQNTWEMKGDHDWYSPEEQYYRDGMGLFGRVYKGTVKNLTIKNFSSDGEIATTGCVAAYADGATFENIAIFNCNPRVYNIGNGGIVGCVGWYAKEAGLETTFKNITVDNSNKISALWGSYDVACGGIVGQYYPTSGQTSANKPANGGIDFVNCHVAAQMDVYNDVCANYQYYAYRYTGMLIGSVRENETIDGHVYPKMDGITASGCTVHYETWNDYFYCELVANSKASYTHDHQFSRLTEVKAVEGNTITPLKGEVFTVPSSGRYNYVVVNGEFATENATCYHFVDGSVWEHSNAGTEVVNGTEIDVEDHSHIYLPFAQLFTGYGWGVTSRGLSDFDGVETMDVTYRDSTDLIEKFEKNSSLSGNFLYRVGNKNAFPIGKLFQEIDDKNVVDSGVHVSVKSLVEGVQMIGTFVKADNWEDSTLHITGGTGPALLTIQDYNNCLPFELVVEVVDATNIIGETISSLGTGNVVLLNNTKLNSGGSLSLSGASLYGNDFEIDVSAGKNTGGQISSNYLLNLANSTIDNVHIVGEVYTKYGAQASNAYNNPVIRSSGNSVILNSYVANCASPVRVTGGNLEIVNSTLKGGNFANIDIRNGHVVLDNVTTINQVNGNDTAADGTIVFGLGVVIFYENVSSSTTIEIKNGITQYNNISSAQAEQHIKDTNAKNLVNVMFNSQFADVQYKDGTTTWANAGIVSMATEVGNANITDVNGYSHMNKTVSIQAPIGYINRDVYVHTQKPSANSIESAAREYATAGQGAVAPTTSFDYKNKNYIPKSDNSNDYCYEEGGTVYISMDEGDTFNWDATILNVSKNGKTVSYDVTMNGANYTGKSITFDSEGRYEVVYTYTDSNNYKLDGNKIISYDKTYTKKVHISVTVVAPDTKHAEFTFGSNNQATEKIVIGNNTYISATGVSHDNSKWSYITVNGQKIFYPIVEATIVSKKTAYFNVFKNVVTITDYDTDGNPVQYSADTTKNDKTLPSGLSVANGKYGTFASISSNWSTLNDSQLNFSADQYGENMAGKVFSYAAADGTYGSVASYDSALCYKSPDLTNSRDEYYTIAKYCYTDNTGTPYYYYVGYHMAAKGDGSCFTPDTLITLADGKQVRVDSLTGDELLLVWNLETGKYEAAPIVFVDSETEADYEIIHLYFSDGSDVKVIYEHGFFDLDLGEYVYIDANNYAEFIGHRFVAEGDLNANGWKIVTLDDVVIETERTTAWSPVTFEHLCYYTNGVLSMPGGISGLFNIFEVDTNTMRYDAEQMQKDIDTYGLFTLEDFGGMITEEAFAAFNGAYLKVAMGKGLLTWEDIAYMAERYIPLM